jgi:repressor of nif and glnA expression
LRSRTDVTVISAVVLRTGMTDTPDVAGRVLSVLEAAEEPLSTGSIQRRVAAEGLDVATGAIRDACDDLVEAGEVEPVGEAPRRTYRAVS